ncbi:hypothetical protein ACC846_39325, partial [Rhizobium ruizarguesonis]
PDNPHLPVLIYRGLFADGVATDFDRRFAANGWTGIWTNGVFDYQHYHSGALSRLEVPGSLPLSHPTVDRPDRRSTA